MADDAKLFKVSTWEKAMILRRRKGWSPGAMVAFLNAKRVIPQPITEKNYKAWEGGSVNAPKETEERIDDVIAIELYRTQPTSNS